VSTSVSVAGIHTRTEEHERTWASEPRLMEVFLLSSVCYCVYVLLLAGLGNYWHIFRTFGDNQAYVWIAEGIRGWNFKSIKEWQFFGLPYLMVVFSFLTHASYWTALLSICVLSAFATMALSQRLWGGWVAGVFAVCSRDWMERAVIGGAEPLFLALIFGSFVAARRDKWLLAAFLAAFGTVVRPMGIFALVAIATVLLLRRKYQTLAGVSLIGLLIGSLYVLPLKLYLGSPLANVHAYGAADGSGGKPLTLPFYALLQNQIPALSTRLNVARAAFWIVLVILAVAAMFRNRWFRAYAREHLIEVIFCSLYIGLLFTYNSPWARIAFPRYVIPVIPFLVLALLPWLPKDRRLLWAFGLLSAMLSAAETYGFTSTLERLRQIF
jgi:Glycosyltransferase family 87